MFENKREITDAVDRLWNAFGGAERGTILQWHELENVMGVAHHEYPGRTIIIRFLRRLERDQRIVTWYKDGVGIRLLTHQQTATLIPEKRQRKAYRQVNRAIRQTDTVDGAVLSDHNRKVLSMQRHNLRFHRLQIGRSYRDLEKATRKTEVNPIRKQLAPVG